MHPAIPLLHQWLQARCEQAMPWLTGQAEAIAAGKPQVSAMAMALTPRHTGKGDLCPSAQEVAAGQAVIPGFSPASWSLDQVARTYLLCHLPATSGANLADQLKQLLRTADVAEAVAIYQALPCLPFPEALVSRACEGIRSNQRPLVAAVAVDNPYPAAHLPVDAWNQMVLKCLFIGLPLYRVLQLDERHNPALSRMLLDYARERLAAKRPVRYELWRPAVAAATAETDWALIRSHLRDGDALHRRAIALALQQLRSDQPAQALLAEHPKLVNELAHYAYDWAQLEGYNHEQ